MEEKKRTEKKIIIFIEGVKENPMAGKRKYENNRTTTQPKKYKQAARIYAGNKPFERNCYDCYCRSYLVDRCVCVHGAPTECCRLVFLCSVSVCNDVVTI